MKNSYVVDALRGGEKREEPAIVKRNRYGMPERTLYDSEFQYFKANPGVAGMAAEDNAVILNPFSRLSEKEQDAVRMNESARLLMRGDFEKPNFALTPEQQSFLSNTEYANADEANRQQTVAARLLSGDPSAGRGTPEQMEYVSRLRQALMAAGSR